MTTAQNVGFEIDALLSSDDETTFKVVVSEDEDGNPISGFMIVGKNSQQYQDAQNTVRRENLKRNAKRSTQIDSSTDIGADQLAKIIVRNDRTVAIAVVVDWFGFNVEGQPAAFDRSKMEQIFAKRPLWQDKVIQALQNETNFMTN